MSGTVSTAFRLRLFLASVALVGPPVAIAVTFVAWRGGLPGLIAVHWSDLAAADGALPIAGVFLSAVIAAAAATAAGLVLVLIRRMGPRVVRGSMSWLGTVQGIAATAWIGPAWVTYLAGSAEEAVLGPWVVLLVASALYGAVPYALYPRVTLLAVRSVRTVAAFRD